MNYLSELKRRNIIKVSVAYLVLSWVILQVVDVITPVLFLPESLARIVFVMLAILFPITLIIAWAFELTPEGFKKTDDVVRSESMRASTGQKINYIIIGLLAIAVIFLVYDRGAEPEPEEIVIDELVDEPVTIEDVIPVNSIAVLPFINMSSDPEQEYFSDGISEEILNVLAQIKDLKVTSRSSTFMFKGAGQDIPAVAKQLGVSKILEGSVRKSGNRIRITAQLIEAETNFHLWSGTYDRDLSDIFAVQDEISLAIVTALKSTLNIGTVDLATTKTNPEAYTAYLKGLYYWKNISSLNDDVAKAREFMEQSIALDDGYAPAHAYLSMAVTFLTANVKIPIDIGQSLAFLEADRAIELDPENELGYVARGLAAANFNLDYISERTDLEHALSLNPNNAEIYHMLSINSNSSGNFEQGLMETRKGISLNPMDKGAHLAEAYILYFMEKYDQSTKIIDIMIASNQGIQLTNSLLSYNYIRMNRFEDALAKANTIERKVERDHIKAMAYFGLGNIAASDEALELFIDEGADGWAYQIAETYCFRGEIEPCLDWLERSYELIDPGLRLMVISPFLRPVRQNPRYIAIREKLFPTN